MRLFRTIAGLRCFLELQRSQQRVLQPPIVAGELILLQEEVGLVPTMGALHQGHLSLIRRARRENAIVVVSLFVNPLQFGPHEDFDRYPRALEQDRALCVEAGVDAMFAPTVEEMYGQGEPLTQVMPPPELISRLCGAYRPGHFPGVATIVTKLLTIVQPDRAYFGQKDAQQVAVIRRLVSDLNLPVEVVACPILREVDGLAMSSRNQYLTPEQRLQATILYRSLQRAEQIFQRGERDSSVLIEIVRLELATVPELQLEYIEMVDPITMIPMDRVIKTGLMAVAARLGSTRLIDNILLRPNRKPMIAIDGPAGAGKSTVTRLVAQSLGLLYLDTGAMYRAVTWLVLESGISLQDEPAVAELVSRCRIELVSQADLQAPPQVWINGQEVTEAIRTPEVTAQVSTIAAQPAVRQELVKQQQRYGEQGGIAIEGRDIGTYVFPDAEIKIFLTASVLERARRRQQDLKNQGKGEISLEELEHAILERDRKDSTRALAPLRQAEDAIEILTDGLTVAEVVDRIVRLYQEKC
ncbi:cytidylate kinase [Leptolyngbya sp. 'hensonii']|nr:bifunctional pantoate--beta-alanine ligase/(d)CMP kinase [Leptolyngbya sp. 'hensonii']OLP16623.1 cytidylate kinase [Leptolyngbya sp. 'hensonii']